MPVSGHGDHGAVRRRGTVAFLVGVGFVEGDHFTIEQYLMRDYGDAARSTTWPANRMDGFDYVCTFNGRTFDMPLLEARFTMTRMRHRCAGRKTWIFCIRRGARGSCAWEAAGCRGWRS